MPTEYEVQNGDCISSIAFNHGFFWETLWNDGSNSELKSKRKDPNILREGDVVHIPDLTLKEESGATEKCHSFKLKGVPAKLKLKLMRPKLKAKKKEPSSSPAPGGGSVPGGLGGLAGAVSSALGLPTGGGGSGSLSNGADPDFKPPAQIEEEAMANADYVLEVDGKLVDQGKTDGEGVLKISLIPNARVGKLIINEGKPDERIITLDLGGMDPVEETTGVRKRLKNLGFFCQAQGPADAPELKAALKKFQERNSLEITGNVNDATRNKLKEVHGS